ncbi:TlpA family protein disulfide reductase [Pedobacter mendelii]|uniref:Thiol:disulfide interchange protein n=1 Tax=Pedobacter mendelii TaxID=1908240 RepID=A0ABQ2BF52_9SPHI|nr:TlpA disulfide reductase family protein [Pedobacter mendelii]GGI22495.1 thiol:disulfide interchange protein [Pedobacter mendelii]
MKIILYIIFILVPISIFAQDTKSKEFKIYGIVNADTGTISIEMAEVKELYPLNFKNIKVNIKGGKFNITGKIDYPIWCVFRLGDKYVSSSTPIDFGKQTIILNLDSNYQSPKNSNSITAEIAGFDKFFSNANNLTTKYDIRYDSLAKIYKDKLPEEIKISLAKERRMAFDSYDSTIMEYVKINPGSYYALFKLYHLINFGYNKRLGSAYDYFSVSLKNSSYGKELNKNILVAKTISVGAIIPEFKVINSKGEKIHPKPYGLNKYTLVDFWYSSCRPCLSQFPDLIKIRSQYASKGFEIIGISIDKEKYLKDWEDAIVKHKMSWPQYLDLNGLEAKGLNIKVFPTNFLVNQSGRIIATNILPAELKNFLTENLN